MARGGFFGVAAALAVVLFYPGTLQWRTMSQKNKSPTKRTDFITPQMFKPCRAHRCRLSCYTGFVPVLYRQV